MADSKYIFLLLLYLEYYFLGTFMDCGRQIGVLRWKEYKNLHKHRDKFHTERVRVKFRATDMGLVSQQEESLPTQTLCCHKLCQLHSTQYADQSKLNLSAAFM